MRFLSKGTKSGTTNDENWRHMKAHPSLSLDATPNKKLRYMQPEDESMHNAHAKKKQSETLLCWFLVHPSAALRGKF
jgi:hypothetical protein